MGIDGVQKEPPGSGGTFAKRFAALVALSFAHAPLALLLALASAVVGFCLLSAAAAAPPPVTEAVAIGWAILAHTLFTAYLCAWIGLPAAAPPHRRATAARAALRATLPLAPIAGAALLLPLVHPLLSVAVWFIACVTAAPARFVDHGWRGWTMLARPLALPLAGRAALLLPSLVFLSALASLPWGSLPFGLLEGGALVLMLLGLALWWGFYSAALFSAAFARPMPFDIQVASMQNDA